MSTTAAKERSLRFYPHEIRSVLDGEQGQFRRLVRPQPQPHSICHESQLCWHPNKTSYHCFTPERSASVQSAIPSLYCPYGQAGDHLWIREDWANIADDKRPDCFIYKADQGELSQYSIWTPAIHMPRKASRITLEIVGIKAQRLQEISEEEAIAEGIFPYKWDEAGDEVRKSRAEIIVGFSYLWDSIYRDRGYGWDSNPFVWAVSFKRIAQQTGGAA